MVSRNFLGGPTLKTGKYPYAMASLPVNRKTNGTMYNWQGIGKLVIASNHMRA